MTKTRQVLAFVMAGAADAGSEASAQSMTLYGRLYPELILTRMTGATAPGATGLSTLAGAPSGASFDSVTKMDASNSRLGVRGEEPLGNGVRAFFQIEQRILVDTGNPPNTGIASRDTFVGLRSDRFGTLNRRCAGRFARRNTARESRRRRRCCASGSATARDSWAASSMLWRFRDLCWGRRQ